MMPALPTTQTTKGQETVVPFDECGSLDPSILAD